MIYSISLPPPAFKYAQSKVIESGQFSDPQNAQKTTGTDSLFPLPASEERVACRFAPLFCLVFLSS